MIIEKQKSLFIKVNGLDIVLNKGCSYLWDNPTLTISSGKIEIKLRGYHVITIEKRVISIAILINILDRFTGVHPCEKCVKYRGFNIVSNTVYCKRYSHPWKHGKDCDEYLEGK